MNLTLITSLTHFQRKQMALITVSLSVDQLLVATAIKLIP